MALKDTLKAIRDKAEAEEDFEAKKPQILKAWRESVLWLEDTIAGWLKEYEKDGALSLSRDGVFLEEEAFGNYPSQALNILVGPTVVRIQPVGRMIIGATGRVDMYRQGRPTDDQRVLFLRLDAEAPDKWGIRMPLGGDRSHPVLQPFTQEIFESALDGLLR